MQVRVFKRDLMILHRHYPRSVRDYYAERHVYLYCDSLNQSKSKRND